MPGRLSRCFTGRWNENRFREAKVKGPSRFGGSKRPRWRVGVARGGDSDSETWDNKVPHSAVGDDCEWGAVLFQDRVQGIGKRERPALARSRDGARDYWVAGVTPTIPQFTLVRPVTAGPRSRSPNDSVVPGLTAPPVWSVRSTCFCARSAPVWSY